jgi:hypothetical protein
MMSAEQEENVKTQKFNRLVQSLQVGAIDLKFFHEASNRGGLFDLQMENVQGLLNPDGVDQPDVVKEDGDGKDEDTDDPGSDRANTQKSKALATGGAPKGGGKQPKEKPEPREAKSANGTGGLVIVAPSLNAIAMIRRYSTIQRIGRILQNSAAYDRAAYEADGGDKWIDPRRHELFKDPPNADKALWAKAKAASKAALGEERWQFTVWMYRKLGGRF